MSIQLGINWLIRHERGMFSIDQNMRRLDRFSGRRLRDHGSTIRAVYCYEDAALHTFRRACSSGIKTFYDLPIAYWRLGRRIHEEEAEFQPAWAMTLGGLWDSLEKLARKDEELSLADAIFCASSFTRDSLDLYPEPLKAPVHVVPYGAPECSMEPQDLRVSETGSPLQVLFVGGLSQRKGLSYLFEAAGRMGAAVELTVVGRRPEKRCPELERELERCRYIQSLTHEGILQEMSRADVFLFPSLFEGFGLVLLEAMSRGVPCITTPHTAGPDFIEDGVDGFIVPVRDVDSMVEKLELLHADRDRLAGMKQAALVKARQCTWKAYRDGMVGVIRKELGL